MATKKTVVKGKKQAEKTTKKASVAKKTVQTSVKKVAVKKPAAKKATVTKTNLATKKPVVKKAAASAKATKPTPKKAAATKASQAAKKSAPAKVVKPTPKKAAAQKKEVKKTIVKKATPKKATATKVLKPVAKKEVVKTVSAKTSAAKPVAKKAKATKPEKLAIGIAKKIKKETQPLKEVKLPKITTTAKKSYNPSYTPMEQRETNVNQEPLVRYSEEELQEFKDLIIKKLADAKREVNYLQGIITRKDDMGGDIESRYMTMEDGTVSMEREQLSQMASRQIGYIDNLEKALIRIENKTYGICRVTGKLIDKARLRAVPHATLSIEAKLNRRNNSEQ